MAKIEFTQIINELNKVEADAALTSHEREIVDAKFDATALDQRYPQWACRWRERASNVKQSAIGPNLWRSGTDAENVQRLHIFALHIQLEAALRPSS
jgi:hypothetical protein